MQKGRKAKNQEGRKAGRQNGRRVGQKMARWVCQGEEPEGAGSSNTRLMVGAVDGDSAGTAAIRAAAGLPP